MSMKDGRGDSLREVQSRRKVAREKTRKVKPARTGGREGGRFRRGGDVGRVG